MESPIRRQTNTIPSRPRERALSSVFWSVMLLLDSPLCLKHNDLWRLGMRNAECRHPGSASMGMEMPNGA